MDKKNNVPQYTKENKINFKDYKASKIINEIEDILNKENLDSDYKIPVIKYLIDKWREVK